MLMSDSSNRLPESNGIIRDALEADLPGIVKLQEDAGADVPIPPDVYEAIWHWLYARNPTGLRKAMLGIEPVSGRVIAHEALLPFRIRVDGRGVTAGFICGLVVAKDYRKTLMFLTLEKRLLGEYVNAGMDVAYGALLPRMLKAHSFFGFRTLGLLPVLARPYRITKLATHYVKSPALQGAMFPFLKAGEMALRWRGCSYPPKVRVTRENSFSDQMDGFLTKACGGFRACAERTAAILNWRFVGVTGRDYRIFVSRISGEVAGYMVLRPMRMMGFDTMAIVDILYPPDRADVGKALLCIAHDETVRSQADLAVCLLSEHTPYLGALKRFGYMRTPEAFTLVAHEPQGRTRVLDETLVQGWHVTWFDHDYV